jgi:hypothetical protein
VKGENVSLNIILVSVSITITIILSYLTLPWILVSSASPPSSYTWSNLDKNVLEVGVTYTRKIYEYGAQYNHYSSYYECVHWDSIMINWDYGGLQIKYDNGQSKDNKYLHLYLDDNIVYQLGSGNWGSTDFKDVCSVSKSSHSIKLVVGGEEPYTPSVTVRVVEKKTAIVHADEHSAVCYKDDNGAAHTFKFTVPSESGTVIRVEWDAKWGDASRSGWGDSSLMGKQMTILFNAENLDCWRFKDSDSVVIRMGGSPPGVEPAYADWRIDAYYNEGADSIGLKEVAVAINDGNLVGYRSAKYLVTDIQLHDLEATGHTGGEYWKRSGNSFDVWANKGSEVRWRFIVKYFGIRDGNPQWCYDSTAWTSYRGEKCEVKGFSNTYTGSVQYTSKGKTSSLTLTLTCGLNIHFDELKAIPIEAYAVTHRGNIPLTLKKPSETEAYVEVSKANGFSLGIKTVDALGEFSKMDYYSLSSSGSGKKAYAFTPSSYKGITCVTNASVTVRWIWFKLWVVVYGASRLSGDEYWVDCARGGATVEVYAQFEDTGEYAKGVSVFDCYGNTVSTDSSGKATFHYGCIDMKVFYYYYVVNYAYYDDYDGWSDGKSITIVYTRILLAFSFENTVLFNGKYFALNGTSVKLKVNAKYSHDKSPVSGASIYFFNLSRTTDSNGNVEFNICSNDEEISSRIYASKWVISGQTNPIAIVFTGASLIPFRYNEPCYLIEDSPGASFTIVLKVYLTYNKSFINGLDVKWVQGNMFGKTPASFTLTMPSSPANMTFELVNFIPCKPVSIILIPRTVELSMFSVEDAVLRNGEYWNKSGSTIRVKLKARYLYCNESVAGVAIRDTEGNWAVADSNGFAEFSYNCSDRRFSPTYTAYDDRSHVLGGLQGPVLIFSRVNLGISITNAAPFNGIYYAVNDANATVFVNTTYSHDGKPVANITVSFLDFYSTTNESGVAGFRLSGSDREYRGLVAASDGLVEGSMSLSLVFTDVTLEPSQRMIKAAAGAQVSVTIYARLSYSNEYLSGLRVKWVQGDTFGETSTPFNIVMPSLPINGTFSLIGFLPCPDVNVTLLPKTVELLLENIVGAGQRGGEYWTQSGSTIIVRLKARYMYCDDHVATITVTDGDSLKPVGEDGFAEFSYSDKDRTLPLSFLAVDGKYVLSQRINITLVFTRIGLKITTNATPFNSIWYACSNASVSITVNAAYTHNGMPASNSSITYLNASAKTDEKGTAVLKLSGSQRKYEENVKASDGVVWGDEKLVVIFTGVMLEPSASVIEGFPEDDALLTIRVKLTYSNEYLSGLRVKWVENSLIKETPARFMLKVPEKGSVNATFILEGFLACCEKLVVRVVSVNASLTAKVNGTLRDGKYWVQSGSTVSVRLKLRLLNSNLSVSNLKIVDSYGDEALTDLNGTAVFYYSMSDRMATIGYTLFSNNGKPLETVNATLVFSRIVIDIEEVKNAVCFNSTYYASNGANVQIVARAMYSHDESPVANAKVSFFSKLSETDSNGSAVISLSDDDKEYSGLIEIEDGVLSGNTPVSTVFTGIVLEPSSDILAGAPGENASVIIRVRLSYNNKTLDGLKIRWVEGNISREAPANFTLRILDSPVNATFVLEGFLPCNPYRVLVVPGVEFSIINVKGAVKRGDEYWAQSNSTVTLMLSIRYMGGGPAVGTIVNDSRGNMVSVPSNGNVSFYYKGSDEALRISYAAAKGSKRLTGGLNLTIVFTRLLIEVVSVEGGYVGGEYWANSYSTVSVAVRVRYSHSGELAKKAMVSLLGYSASVENGAAIINVTGVDRRYVGSIEASDGAIWGEDACLRFLFTRIILNVTRLGDTVRAKAFWAHDRIPVEGLRIKIFQTDQVSVTDSKGEAVFVVKGVGGDILVYALDKPNEIYTKEAAIPL